MDVTVTKEEILHAEKSSDVWRWIQAHPDDDLTEVAAYFNKLALEEECRANPDGVLWTPRTLNRQ